VALHTALSFELVRDHERLEMLAVPDDLDSLAGESCFDAALDAFRCDHR